MEVIWDERHGKILMDFFSYLNQEKIKWFILRGYEGLPEHNNSKDVDIMIEVGKERCARKLLKQSFKDNGMTRIHSVQFGHAHCYIGTSTENAIAIHIDLIEGYISKGYEIFTFDELNSYVTQYNGMNVLNDFMNGIMLIVYKIFGYHHAKLKQCYCDSIYKAQNQFPDKFIQMLQKLVGDKLGEKINYLIAKRDFDSVIKLEPEFTKQLKYYTRKERPMKTLWYCTEFIWQKAYRIIFRYRKYSKSFAVIAPDGTGKTTFLDMLLEEMNYYYVNDDNDCRFHVYHFRPEVLPNLGIVGEKTGLMKQDTDFTNPHRSKPANPVSSLFRIAYYTLDYIVGWQKCVRRDVHYDRYSVFDRYSYDFIVDPCRSKLNLPEVMRKFFVAFTPQPKIVFYLNADPNVIFARKQELTLEEIQRQVKEYQKLADSNLKKFKVINAEDTPQNMVKEAVEILLNQFTEKL